jgi:uncharacterized membrane protein YgcG
VATITLYRMKLRKTNADQAHRTHGKAAGAAALEYDLLAPLLPAAYLFKTQASATHGGGRALGGGGGGGSSSGGAPGTLNPLTFCYLHNETLFGSILCEAPLAA